MFWPKNLGSDWLALPFAWALVVREYLLSEGFSLSGGLHHILGGGSGLFSGFAILGNGSRSARETMIM